MIYTGKSGKIYAETVERDKDRYNTTVVDLSNTSTPVKIFEYSGEATHLSIAESSEQLAIVCGSLGAFIYDEEITCFERTKGLPVKLLGSDDFFVSLDSEGNIAWHDNRDGKILAVFSLYKDRWVLVSATEISGRFSPHTQQ
jgi:hypothetical protein